jgi:hypothetical protein
MRRRLRNDRKLDRLRRTAVFGGCTSQELLLIGSLADEATFTAGTVLARKGMCPRQVVLIDGTFVAGQAALDGTPASESVVVERTVRALVFDIRSYRRLAAVLPHVTAATPKSRSASQTGPPIRRSPSQASRGRSSLASPRS